MASRNLKCLLVNPRFTSQSFWNYTTTCELLNAKYPAAPLGLATVATLLPNSWDLRLVDCNVEVLGDDDIQWADVVLSGGMISQQREHLKLIQRTQEHHKLHIVGGPDATSSPHVYDGANYLVLGEAEITLPEFLKDFCEGIAKHIYAAEDRKADMSKAQVPRFDLLKFNRYLHVGIQFSRGCPFKCEFCDIIELFGRVPRAKHPEHILSELQRLYDLGYRGHVDLVDDNFIGNKRAVKELLPKMKDWLEKHNWPFEFSTEASMNISDDEQLMNMMQEVGFCSVFVGIETSNEETLVQTQKKQNTQRSIPECIHKIFNHGMVVNAGFIVGFDNEKSGVSREMLNCIHETAIPATMVGLLFALPNTQLSRRLSAEGRLQSDSEYVPEDVGDQCVAGLNFKTLRPKHEILEDYQCILEESFDPKNYFERVRRLSLMLNCSQKRLNLPLKKQVLDLYAFLKFLRAVFKIPYRKHVLRALLVCALKNPKAFRYTVALSALYLHFGPFKNYVVGRIKKEIAHHRQEDERVVAASCAQVAF